MAAPARILDARGTPIGRPAPRPRSVPIGRANIRARYDAAQTVNENFRHWANADSLSARAANTPEVRQYLRDRARYETANNTYAKGIVLTLANDTIGTGPRLQLLTPNAGENRRIAAEFERWTAAVGLAEKLRTMRMAKAVDGEAFAVQATNEMLSSPVQLDLRLIEAEQVATPFGAFADPDLADGIRFDAFGNPRTYSVLRAHPGDLLTFETEADDVPADLVLHWFRSDRPGQVRGVPEITPALHLFAQLRRYTLAVLAAAETAADFAAVLFSEMAPDEEDFVDGDPFETLEIERRMMTTLPRGWKMGQFKAEQPATTYAEFKNEVLDEIARCLNMPSNVARGNSSNYNYASGRLDHQVYYKSIAVDQYHLETAILDRILMAWMREAYMVGLVDEPPDRLGGWPHVWHWDGREHVDPTKEASAQETRLKNNTTTLADEWARAGHDWREKIAQRAEEVKLLKQLGITQAEAAPARPAAPVPANGDDDEDEDAED